MYLLMKMGWELIRSRIESGSSESGRIYYEKWEVFTVLVKSTYMGRS